MTTGRRVLRVVCLALLGGVLALAQVQLGTGAISSVVADPSGQVIPGAMITIVHADTGLTRTISTTGAGVFTVPVLPPRDLHGED